MIRVTLENERFESALVVKPKGQEGGHITCVGLLAENNELGL